MSKLKLLFGAALALMAFAAVSTSASAAYTAEISPAGEIEGISNGRVTFGSGPEIECNLTLYSNLNSSVSVEVGASLGSVTEVEIEECEGGSGVVVLNLPWSLTIAAILGTAPDNMTGLLFDINNASFNLSVFEGIVNCLYQGTAGALLAAVDTGTNTYSTGNIEVLEEIQLPKHSGSFLCPGEGGLEGEFSVEPSQSITVR